MTPDQAPGRRAQAYLRGMRSTVLAFAFLLTAAMPASASYLHVARARPAARVYVREIAAPVAGATDSSVGRCWHAGPHVVQCSYKLVGAITVCGEGDICDLPLNDESSVTSWVVAVARRGDGLYAHTLWLDSHGYWVAP